MGEGTRPALQAEGKLGLPPLKKELIRPQNLREGLNRMVLASSNPYYFDANMNVAIVYEQPGEREKLVYYYTRAGEPHGGRQFNPK